MKQNTLEQNLKYRWVVFAVSILMVAVSLGFCSVTKGLFKVPVANALLNGDRGPLSINDSIRFITTAVVNLFFGTLITKFGLRKLVAAGFISLTISMVLYAVADGLVAIYLGGMFLGIGLSWASTTMVGYVIRKWFTKNTGTVMGFVLAANGLGGAIATQIVSPLINREGDLFAYRDAYWVIAGVLAVAGLTIVLLIRDRKDVAVQKSKKDITEESRIAFRKVSRTPTFYVAGACVFLSGVAMQAVNSTSVAHMTDVGISAEFRTSIVTLYSVFLVIFKFLTGVSRDRFGLRKTLMICTGAAVLMIGMLAFIDSSPAGYTMATIYNLFIPVAMPLQTVIPPLITAELFDDKSYAKALGVMVSFNTAGSAVGAFCADMIYDLIGTYQPIFIALSVGMILVGVVFQVLLQRTGKKQTAEAVQ